MKGLIEDVVHSFKSKPFRTLLMLSVYPLLISLILTTATLVMVATLSIENGIDWLKDAWL